MGEDPPSPTGLLVAAFDAAYSTDDRLQAGAAVLVRLTDFQLLACQTGMRERPRPYVPGEFFRREGPLAIDLVSRLPRPFDMLFIHGHGRAHPKRKGLAARVGKALGQPTVGVADRPLAGSWVEPEGTRGSSALLYQEEETVGALLRTRTGVRPVVVSVGFGTTLQEALAVTLAAAPRFRWPEPMRRAHAEAVRRLAETTSHPPASRGGSSGSW